MIHLASTLKSFKVPEGIEFYDTTEDDKREFERRKFERIKQSGIPRIFWDAELSQCEAAVVKWAEDAKAGSSNPLLLQGNVGNGKSYAASAAMISMMPEKRCEFSTFDAILEELTAAFSGSETSKSVIDHLKVVPVLCIDDLGKTKPTEWNISKLFEIINARWGNKKLTIYTTQYNNRELLGRLTVNNDPENAKAIISRIVDDAVIVKMSGKDRRIS